MATGMLMRSNTTCFEHRPCNEHLSCSREGLLAMLKPVLHPTNGWTLRFLTG